MCKVESSYFVHISKGVIQILTIRSKRSRDPGAVGEEVGHEPIQENLPSRTKTQRIARATPSLGWLRGYAR